MREESLRGGCEGRNAHALLLMFLLTNEVYIPRAVLPEVNLAGWDRVLKTVGILKSGNLSLIVRSSFLMFLCSAPKQRHNIHDSIQSKKRRKKNVSEYYV